MCSGNRAPGDQERCSVRELSPRCVSAGVSDVKAYSRALLRARTSRPRTLMFHTIELITETCHDARWYFLLMGLEASFVKRLAGLT